MQTGETMNNGDRVRLSHLENQLNSIKEKIDQILENHLPHIREDIAILKTRVIIGFTIAGFIIGILAEYILRKL